MNAKKTTKTKNAKKTPDAKVAAAMKVVAEKFGGRGLTSPMLRLIARAYDAGFDAGFEAAELLNR